MTHPAHAAGIAALRELEAAGFDGDVCTCEDCTVRVILEAAAPLLAADRDTPVEVSYG